MSNLSKEKLTQVNEYFESQIKDDGVGSKEERVNKIIKQTCWVCAVVAVFPIPIADTYFLTSIQFLMAKRVGEIYGKKMGREDVVELMKTLGLTMVLGYLAQQTALGLYRTILPVMGAVSTVPLVYSLTFAIGKILHKYFEMNSKGQTIDGINFKEIWKDLKSEGEEIAKKLNMQELKAEAEKVYNTVLGRKAG